MVDIKRKIVAFFGLRHSWKWATRQMKKGHIVYRKTDSGAARYRLDDEGQQRIEWCFCRKMEKPEWESANIFLSDFECTSWEIFIVK